MAESTESNVYLIAGASGNLGKMVLERLVEAGSHQIIATTRTPAKLAEYEAKGVVVRAADYAQPKEDLVEAFRGATHMLLISTLDVGSRHEHHENALDAAIAAGVKHIFYTSHSHPDTSTSPVAPEHGMMERAIKARGVTYTMLRNFLYSENILLSFAEAGATGTHYSVEGDGKVAWISRGDCAAAAAGAMLDASSYENATLDVTGPRAYSNAELVAAVSEAIGRPIVHLALPAAEYEARLVANGFPAEVAKVLTGLEIANSLGDHDLVNYVARRLSGRDLEKLEDFLAANAGQIDPARSLNTLFEH